MRNQGEVCDSGFDLLFASPDPSAEWSLGTTHSVFFVLVFLKGGTPTPKQARGRADAPGS
jgi:hypothetical protein